MAKRKLAFWKAYQGKGAAALFESDVREGKPVTFLSIMPEIEGKRFDSKNKLSVKLGPPDLAEFLMVLNRHKGGVGAANGEAWKGLFHENASGSATIGFSVKEDKSGLYLHVSVKKGDAAATRLGVSVSLAEAELLKIFVEEAVKDYFVDSYQSQPQQETQPA